MIEKELSAPTYPQQTLYSVFIEHFKSIIRGEVILPEDAAYEEGRHVHNLLFDAHPILIVRPMDADDVVKAVHFAADRRLTVAVRGGGHGNGGYGTVDDGLVIDLSLMRNIRIDAEARTAYAEGGITAGEYTNAAIAQGFITPFGDSPSVGLGGLTLGGGVGWLSRKLGLTIDSLVSAEVVTADGSKLHVSEEEHPDLFWAIRGGGGNFGIITSFELRLHPIETVLGGALYLPATRNVIRGVIDLSLQAPDELTTISMLMHLPPMPELPKKLHGQLAFMVTPVWLGDLEAGQRALAPFRALAEPLADQIRPMPFTDMYEMNAQAAEPYTSVGRAMMADELDDTAIEAMLAHMETSQLPAENAFTVVQIRPLGGAIARVLVEATAFAARDANLVVSIGTIGFENAEHEAYRSWVESLFEALRHNATGAYLNFLEDEGEARIHEAYPEATYARLAEIKRRYDPDNFFHLNQNIPPAKG